MEKKIKANILITAGSNCDRETEHAFKLAGAETERVHINDVISGRKNLDEYHILVFPGGFSFGDDIAAGKIFANKVRFRLGEKLEKFHREGKLIIGICNGFQVLAKIGILPVVSGEFRQTVTLSYNVSGKFEDRWLYLKVNRKSPSVFLQDLPEVIQLPIAHGEGRFIPADDLVLDTIRKQNLHVFQYADEHGRTGGNGIHNPNGSVASIAGICDPTGRIIGMMPHPERYVSRLQHPQWCRMDLPEEGVGLTIYRNAVVFAKKNL